MPGLSDHLAGATHLPVYAAYVLPQMSRELLPVAWRGWPLRSMPGMSRELNASNQWGEPVQKQPDGQSPSPATSQVPLSVNVVQITFKELQCYQSERVVRVIHAATKSNLTLIIIQVCGCFQ